MVNIAGFELRNPIDMAKDLGEDLAKKFNELVARFDSYFQQVVGFLGEHIRNLLTTMPGTLWNKVVSLIKLLINTIRGN